MEQNTGKLGGQPHNDSVFKANDATKRPELMNTNRIRH